MAFSFFLSVSFPYTPWRQRHGLVTFITCISSSSSLRTRFAYGFGFLSGIVDISSLRAAWLGRYY